MIICNAHPASNSSLKINNNTIKKRYSLAQRTFDLDASTNNKYLILFLNFFSSSFSLAVLFALCNYLKQLTSFCVYSKWLNLFIMCNTLPIKPIIASSLKNEVRKKNSNYNLMELRMEINANISHCRCCCCCLNIFFFCANSFLFQ